MSNGTRLFFRGDRCLDQGEQMGKKMARVILYMAMSLDGFITGPDDNADNPAGHGGMRLMEWLGTPRSLPSCRWEHQPEWLPPRARCAG